jgi:hypothetical protein
MGLTIAYHLRGISCFFRVIFNTPFHLLRLAAGKETVKAPLQFQQRHAGVQYCSMGFSNAGCVVGMVQIAFRTV